jgi:hypothetical protein
MRRKTGAYKKALIKLVIHLKEMILALIKWRLTLHASYPVDHVHPVQSLYFNAKTQRRGERIKNDKGERMNVFHGNISQSL